MQRKIRPDPLIPDHEVLRKIGGGAYGEVWLARGVTGAMRAVKIVYREDFSDERTFEREFEGILRFEPISRDHRGFVNILHVGRSEDTTAFYYYVMELGDDAHSDGELNPVEYEPRTLRTDMKRSEGEPLGTQFCIETGRRLAEALAELHHRGLTHRDIKPSNVIFVDGKAKLADIGLVAAKDQRTFVGTEGFVPPEGPGTEGADIYALGKVLYEMATGMDRLQFPELPAIGPSDERKKWIKLNRLLCDICDPRVSRRKITTGRELAWALARLLKGKSAARKLSVQQKLAMALIALLVLIGSQLWIERTWGVHVIEGKREPLPTKYVTVKILTDPSGATVFDMEGNYVNLTPHTIPNVKVGSELKLLLTAKGYRDYVIDERVTEDPDGSLVTVLPFELEYFSPPKANEIWEDALGDLYYPQEGGSHQAADHVSLGDWETFREEEGNENLKPIRFNYEDEEIVAVPEEWADRYAEWLMKKCVLNGSLEEYSESELERNREIVVEYDLKFPESKLPSQARKGGKTLRPFRCVVRPIPYGTIRIDSTPQGADVYFNDGHVRRTPVKLIARLKGYSWTVELTGYKTEIGEGLLTEDSEITYHHTLQPDKSVVFGGKPWTNSLDIPMVPLGEDLMVAVWETRTSDFQKFLKAENIPRGQIILSKNLDEPVAGVTREEGEHFCKWLTSVEKLDKPGDPKRIAKNHRYRLPTDEEWSRMVGLTEVAERLEEREILPENKGKYPWGLGWPPPPNAGNYADASAAIESLPSNRTITDYDDGFPDLAPVGQFTPNAFGIHDLGGNVYEWVSDDYKIPGRGIVRGGSWQSFTEDKIESRIRYPIAADTRDETFGFRVVLAKEDEEAQLSPEFEFELEETTEEDDGGNSD